MQLRHVCATALVLLALGCAITAADAHKGERSGWHEKRSTFDSTGYTQVEDPFRASTVWIKDHHQVFVKNNRWEVKKAQAQFLSNKLKTSKASSPKDSDPYFEFVPQYKGTLKPGSAAVTWTSNCLKSVQARIDIAKTTAHLTFAASGGAITCADTYLLIDRQGSYLRVIWESGSHTTEIQGISAAELAEINTHGLHVFYLPDGILGSIEDIFSTLLLFVGPWQLEDNVKFIEDHFDYKFTPRKNVIANIDPTKLRSGDYLAIRTWDGLDPMIMLGTGSHTGHTAMVMVVDGVPYVMESTALKPNWPPPYGIIQHTWDDWLKLAYNNGMDVSIFHLSDAAYAKFNQTAALQWWNSVKGLPYGYHNFFFGWVDTVDANYPPPLDRHVLIFAMILFERIDPVMANSMYGMAFNKRLGTNGLTLPEVLAECDKRNTTILNLITIPEQDSWIYPDGRSMVCDVFVMSMYKAGGLFGPLANQIQVTEFHPRDSYQMNFYDSVHTPLCTPETQQSVCQVMGNYVINLPGWNTVSAYANMNQKCGAMPPAYQRTPGC